LRYLHQIWQEHGNVISNKAVYEETTSGKVKNGGRPLTSILNKCSAVAEMGDRLVTIDMSRKLGCPPFFWGGELDPHLIQCRLGRDLRIPSGILMYPDVWPQQTWTENWGGGLCPFEEGETRSPSNTMWLGPRPTSVPSFILIHPVVLPQYTNVTDRTGQTGKTTVRWHRVNRFTNGRPKTGYISLNLQTITLKFCLLTHSAKRQKYPCDRF